MKLSTYYKIYKVIKSERLKFYSLRFLRMVGMRYLVLKYDPNWLCNLRCQMCYFSAEEHRKHLIKPMSLDLFNKIASDIFPKTRILFLGCAAEPLMTPTFEQYADVVGRYKIPLVCLVTNGQLFNEKIVSSLIKNKFNQIVVSVDGATKETYENIRVGGSFTRLLENLQMIKEMKTKLKSAAPDVRFNFTAMRGNIDELKMLIDLASEVNATAIRIRFLTHWGGVIDYKNEILPEEVSISKILNISPYAKRKNIALIYKGCYEKYPAEEKKQDYKPFECISPWYNMYIRGDGKIRICDRLPFEHGDFSRQTLKEIEQSQVVRNIRGLLLNKPKDSCLNMCKRNFGGI